MPLSAKAFADLAKCMDARELEGVLKEIHEVEWESRQLVHLWTEENIRRDEAQQEIRERRQALRERCGHWELEYEPDYSGNNAQTWVCPFCGQEW